MVERWRRELVKPARAFLMERGIAVRQGQRFLRAELPRILATPPDVLSPRMVRLIEDLAGDWRRLDERVESLSGEIEAVACQDALRTADERPGDRPDHLQCDGGRDRRVCGFSLLKLMRYIKEELLICIATTSSETVLPRIIGKLEQLGCEQSVVGLVVPMGYSFNLDGTCLYLATAAVFLAQATNTPLDVWHQFGLLLILLVTSKGAAGVAGAAFVVLAATLGAESSIPVASVALVLGIHRLMSQGLTPTNLLGNAEQPS